MAVQISLTTDQLRKVLQLPERPYEDAYYFDGTKYFDFSHRELCTLFGISGTASGTPFLFRPSVDFDVISGVIAWGKAGGLSPDLNSLFTLDYTYSRLSGDTASTSAANACLRVQHDLGASYPYGSTTPQGLSTDALATVGAALVAARDACMALQATEIELAQKGRRGAVLIDDSKKTADWQAAANDFKEKYKEYLVVIRPRGMVRSFVTAGPDFERMVLGWVGSDVFDGLFIDSGIWVANGGGIL